MALAKKLEIWRNDLIDMSRSNNLLYYRTSGRIKAGVQFLGNIPQIFARIAYSQRALKIDHLESPLEDDELDKRLRRLRAKAREDLSERGINTLYCAFGLLDWREAEHSDEVIRSPLLLVPVLLTRSGAQGALELKRAADEDIEVNPTLSAKLQHDFRIRLPAYETLEAEYEAMREELSTALVPANIRGTAESPPLPWLLSRIGAALHEQSTWTITPELHLSRFSFQKLAMYHDLGNHAEAVYAHDVLRALAGELHALPVPKDLPRADQLDQHVRPHGCLEILDADSSQQEAIVLAKRGVSFVLQGPPGTGKSQTIANIIAECLGLGKRVLFVSEKMAALEAVRQRLRGVGLEPYCLDLHSARADKKAFFRDLSAVWQQAKEPPPKPDDRRWLSEADALYGVREHLNAYVHELHSRTLALRMTPFEAYAELAHLHDAPDRDFAIPHVEAITRADVERMRSTLSTLLDDVDVLDVYQTHPWREAVVTRYTHELASNIRDHFARLHDTQARLEADLPVLLERLGEQTDDLTYGAAARAIARGVAVLGSPLPPRAWLDAAERARIQTLVGEAAGRCASYRAKRERLEQAYDPAVLDLDHAAVLTALTDACAATMTALQPYGQAPQDIALAHRDELDAHVHAARDVLGQLLPAAQQLASLCSLPAPRALGDIESILRLSDCFLRTPSPPPAWLDPDTFVEVRAVALDALERASRCREIRAELAAIYQPEFFELDPRPLALRFKERYQSPLRHLRPQYHRDCKHLRSLLLPGRTRSSGQLEHDCTRAAKLYEEQTHLTERRIEYARVFGHYYDADCTDWEHLRLALAWATELHSLGVRFPPETQRLLVGPRHGLAALSACRAHLDRTWHAWQREAGFLANAFAIERLLPKSPHLHLAPLDTLERAIGRAHEELRGFWTAARTVAQHLKASPVQLVEVGRPWNALCDDLRLAAGVIAEQAWLDARAETLAVALGSRHRGMDTDWPEVEAALTWTKQIVRMYSPAPIPPEVAALICEGRDAAAYAALQSELDAVRAEAEALDAEWAYCDTVVPRPALAAPGRAYEQTPFTHLGGRIRALLDALPLLERWVGCGEHLRQCDAVGLSPLVRLALRDRPFPRDIVRIFERRFYSLWLDCALERSPALRLFHGNQHERRIQDFRERDARHARLAQRRLNEWLALRQARVVGLSAASADATPDNETLAEAVAALSKEMAHKRHRSIRAIIQRSAPALLELKPCWMMSPLSVSQFLELAQPLFDLVIFDEASQVSAEDAICAILRGRQLIVVGDSKQLPPTRFFATSLSDNDEEEDDEEEHDEEKRVDSILDECVGARLPDRSLRWHYRSRHESLIAFSNHHFYGNRLVTFPSPDADHSAGVRFEYVADGVYDSGKSRTNRREAERIADLVFDFGARHGTLKDLGVIALSQAQQQAICEALESSKRRSPVEESWIQEIDEEDTDGFFVKNLETVQGDERDVIILSVGYGRDATGRVHKRFGPVNLQGGERRLNVAVTRARRRLILVTSMHADDLGTDLANPGAKALRNYLAYAEHGPGVLPNQALADPSGDPESRLESPFEASVYQALTVKGLVLDTQVGCSGYRIDLAVCDPERPGRYLLGIECDGATYHSSHTARDRDRLRQRQLEEMGWTIHRIWSRDWVMDPVGQMRKVMQRLDAIRAGTPPASPGEEGERGSDCHRGSAEHSALPEPVRSPEPQSTAVHPMRAQDTEAASELAPGTPHAALGAVSAPVSAPVRTRHVDGTKQTPRTGPTVAGLLEGSQRRQMAPSVPVGTRHTCETCVFCTQQTSARFLCQLDRTVKVRGPSGKTPGCAGWVRRVT